MNFVRHILTCALGLVVVASAALTCHAAGIARPSFLCAQSLDLAEFVATETGMAARTSCPEIGIGLPEGGSVARSQAGAYDPATGRIDLAPDLDLTTAYGQSYLVHELVHEAQYRTGRAAAAPCPAALEAEAYAVQAQYLRAKGDVAAAGTITALGALLGQCGDGS